MKAVVFICFLIIGISANANIIVLTGTYQGKDIYIQNDISRSTDDWCISKVTVNDSMLAFCDSCAAFTIHLTKMGFVLGDSIEIKIVHPADCKPKTMVPMINPRAPFEVVSMKVEKGILKWRVVNDVDSMVFDVQKYNWHKWTTIGQVLETVGKKEHVNSFDVRPFEHSGKNKYRIRHILRTGKPKYSTAILYESDKPAIEIGDPKVMDILTFSDTTIYEIYDSYGNLVVKGKAKDVDVTSFQKGIYYINYDASMGEFIKK